MALLVALLAATAALAAPPRPVQLTSPYGALVEPKGTLLVPDGASGRIVRVDPKTGRKTVFAKGLGHVYSLAFGPDGLYAGTAAKVVRFVRGKPATVVRGLHDVTGLAVATDGTITVAESTANRVVRFEAGTRKRTVLVAQGIDQPVGLAFDGAGAVLVADSHHGRIVRVRDDGTMETALAGLELPVALTLAPDGTVLVADHVSHLTAGKLLRLRPDGTTAELSNGKIRGLSGAAIAKNGTVYATSFYAPFIGRVTASGALKAFPRPR
ncbi:MAG: Vgb family protein [Gaiellaceae bacterium]